MLLPSLLCSSLLLLPQLLATPTAQPQPTLHPRQDDLETRTFSPSTSSLELQPGGPEQTASATTTYRLETATPPLQLPDTVGLIMPNPWSKLYVGMCPSQSSSQLLADFNDRSQLFARIRRCRSETCANDRRLAKGYPTPLDAPEPESEFIPDFSSPLELIRRSTSFLQAGVVA